MQDILLAKSRVSGHYWGATLKIHVHHSTTVSSTLRGALNWAPHYAYQFLGQTMRDLSILGYLPSWGRQPSWCPLGACRDPSWRGRRGRGGRRLLGGGGGGHNLRLLGDRFGLTRTSALLGGLFDSCFSHGD